MTKAVFDDALPHSDVRLLLLLAASFVGIAAAAHVLALIQLWTANVASQGAIANVRADVLDRTFQVDAPGLQPLPVGLRVSLLFTDANRVTFAITTAWPMILNALAQLGTSVLIGIYIDPEIAGVFAATIAVWFAVPIATGRGLRRRSLAARDYRAETQAKTVEALSDVRAVRGIGAWPWLTEQLRQRLARMEKLDNHVTTFGTLVDVTGILSAAILSTAYLITGYAVIQHHLSVGSVAATVQMMLSITPPLATLATYYRGLGNSWASIRRVLDFNRARPTSVFATGGQGAVSGARDATPISLTNVSFAYPGGAATLLENVCLTLPSGSSTAVVGKSGAGKSTLAHLVLGLTEPLAGTVCAGGAPLSDWNELEFRRRVAATFGDAPLYRASLRDNVRLGRSWISDDDVVAALVMTGAGWMVERFGLETEELWERALDLSSGERQRISLARTIAGRPEVIVWDEATNGLDSASEADLFAQIRTKMAFAAVMLISHRLSTIMQCDRALVLDGGRLVEEGDPQTLIGARGPFADLVAAQLIAS